MHASSTAKRHRGGSRASSRRSRGGTRRGTHYRIALGNGGDDNDGDDSSHAYTIGLWGDLPYSADQATTGVPNLIADMNRAKLAFSVHDGDIKSGSSRCDNEVYSEFEELSEQPALTRLLHAGRQRVDGL